MFERFARYLREQDRSESTVEGYLCDMRSFARWFETTDGEPLVPESVTPLDLLEYRAHLLAVRKQAGATVNRKLAPCGPGWTGRRRRSASRPTRPRGSGACG